MTNNTYELYVLTQTPLHIGGEQEKHWKKDFDYFEEGSDDGPTIIWKVNERKVIDKIGLDHYVNALEKGPGNFKETLRQQGLEDYFDFCDKAGEIQGSTKEIKRMVTEGMRGNPYLPGTSIKGSLRSALFKAAGGSNENKEDAIVYGDTENSLMKFVNISDIYFNNNGRIINTKLFNVSSDNQGFYGVWKTDRNHNNWDFDKSRFTTGLQVIPSGIISTIKIGLKQKSLATFQSSALTKVPEQAAKLLEKQDPLNGLFESLHEYTKLYLEREIAYFANLQSSHQGILLAAYERLIRLNTRESPLLRLGYGSGFHAITGDFQYSDHLEPLELRENGKLRKSRRLAFDWDEQKEEYRFYPLGFIQLLTPEAAAPHLKRQQKERQQKQATIINKPVTQEVSSAKLPAGTSTPDAKPKLVQKSVKQLKKGVKVTGEVVGQQGVQIIIKPFLSGYENYTVKLRYPAGMDTGTIVEIMVKLEGKTLKGQGAPVEKK